MAKIKTTFFCQNCGTQYSKWQGQCTACKVWNTIVEEVIQKPEKSDWKSPTNTSKRVSKALKIKEISYIHAEGYSSSSLKHGPFALLEKDYPVILIAPQNKYFSKNMNVYEEIKSRYATLVFVTDKTDIDLPYTIHVPKNESYGDLLCVIPLQLLAFQLSLSRGYNPDMPRNLAKVVTVE